MTGKEETARKGSFQNCLADMLTGLFVLLWASRAKAGRGPGGGVGGGQGGPERVGGGRGGGYLEEASRRPRPLALADNIENNERTYRNCEDE